MKKILIISPYFYPNINPRPYRWTKIAEHWAAQGHEVHVVTEKLSQSPNDKNDNIIIHAIGYSALKSLVGQQRGAVKTEKSKINWKKHCFQWLNDFFWKKIYFPDDSCIWYFSAKYKTLQSLENEQFDVLISSALPFTAHLVGLAAKQKYPTLKWIADTGDPFSLQKEVPLNNPFFYKNLNFYFEKKVLQYADNVSFTTENTQALYLKYLPDFSKKYHVIPPLLTVSNAIFEEKNDDRFIHLAYFGKFYQQIREPKSIVDFYERVIAKKPDWEGRLKIHIYGDVFDIFKEELSKPYIVLHGLIPREKVAEAMKKANILINISNITDYQLPSKAPDYLFSGKPIVNLFSAKNDAFADFFKDYPLILNWNTANDDAKKGIDFIEKNKNNKVCRETIMQLCEVYTVEKISAAYEMLF